jgi:hypothetical protein
MNASTSGNSRKQTPLEPLQISQINFESLAIIGITKPSELLTPLVSSETEFNDSRAVRLTIRIAIFIPKTLLGKAPIELYQDSNTEEANELKLVVKYDSAEEEPKEYHAWYVSYTHDIKEGEEAIKQIRTVVENLHFKDANPKTSRGTVTHVLQS